jgi:hypothetical protein
MTESMERVGVSRRSFIGGVGVTAGGVVVSWVTPVTGTAGVFDVDPGRFPGDKTTMTFTYCHTPAK